MDNATRRQILERVKQLGYPNTVEALQNPQVLDQYEQQQLQAQSQQQQQPIQQPEPVSFPTPPVTTPNYKVPQPTQSEAKPLVMSFNETPAKLMKDGGAKESCGTGYIWSEQQKRCIPNASVSGYIPQNLDPNTPINKKIEEYNNQGWDINQLAMEAAGIAFPEVSRTLNAIGAIDDVVNKNPIGYVGNTMSLIPHPVTRGTGIGLSVLSATPVGRDLNKWILEKPVYHYQPEETPRQSLDKFSVSESTNQPAFIPKNTKKKFDKGGPKDKGWQEFKTPTGQSLFLDPRFKNQRYYVDEQGNMSNPDQNLMLYDVNSGTWEAGTSMPTLEVRPRYRYEKRPGALGSFETIRIDDDNNTSEIISPNPMETRRDQEKFVNSFNPAAMATEGLISMGQGNVGEGLTELAFSSPLLPKILSKAGRQELKQGFSSTVQPTESKIGDYVKNADFKNPFLKELQGEIVQGKANRKAIAQGNAWLKDWISHPKTQFKINADLNSARPSPTVELIREQSTNYSPNVKEYPLVKQLFNFKNPIHKDNFGVSFTHTHTPEFRSIVKTPYSEYGEWMSRAKFIPQEYRTNITIHEGTHGWTSAEALKKSGMHDQILDMYHPKTLERLKEWKKLRAEGKNPSDFMTANDAEMGYLSDPTEVHARIMELRHQIGLSPDDFVEPGYAKQIMDWVKERSTTVDPRFLDVINHDPQKLANLFNNLWTVTPAVGAGYLGSKLYQNQQQEKPVNKQFVSFKTGGKKCYTCNGSKMKVLYNKANYKK